MSRKDIHKKLYTEIGCNFRSPENGWTRLGLGRWVGEGGWRDSGARKGGDGKRRREGWQVQSARSEDGGESGGCSGVGRSAGWGSDRGCGEGVGSWMIGREREEGRGEVEASWKPQLKNTNCRRTALPAVTGMLGHADAMHEKE